MKLHLKKVNILILILFFKTSAIADFIIPINNEIYDHLNSMQILGHLQPSAIYPEYYDEVYNQLTDIPKLSIHSSIYESINKKFIYSLQIQEVNGVETNILPFYEAARKITSLNKYYQNRGHLLSYKNNNINLFASLLLGLNYDFQKKKEIKYRSYRYYGLEFGGNIQKNLGFYTIYRKGYYVGDKNFIHEDPFIHQSGDKDRKVSVSSELNYKNDILDISIGFGNLGIGTNITNSIILNYLTNPYPYVKFYKKVGAFHFLSLQSQLLSDSITYHSDSPLKSLSLQTLYYRNNNFLFGLGQTVVYGDRAFDFAYLTPLMIYKLVDFKNHGRDNEIVFAFTKWRPIDEIMLYMNFLIDDLQKSRLLTKYWPYCLALQSGIMYQAEYIPIRLSSEITMVGPGTYAHSRQVYSHDNMLLGFSNGSNLLNFAIRISYFSPFICLALQYENMQKGSNQGDPFTSHTKDDIPEFLSGKFSRSQKILMKMNLYLNSFLSANIRYDFINENNSIKNSVYSGLEIKF